MLKFGDRAVSHKRQLVHDFLYNLYVKVSDATPEVSTHSYEGKVQECKALRFRRFRGKRPRLQKKRDDKLDEHNSCLVRQLPPGTYMDYLRIFRAEHPDVNVNIRLFMKVFWRVSSIFRFVSE